VNDQDLDRLLTVSREVTRRPAGEDAARALVGATRIEVARERSQRRSRARQRWTALGIAAGSLALTGAGTLAAYQLSIPPFQTIPDGVQRVSPAVPFAYDAVDGTREQCLAFLEFANLPESYLSRAEAYVRDTDWTGYGDQVSSQAIDAPSAQAQETAVHQAVRADLRSRVEALLPQIETDRYLLDGPSFYGVAVTCNQDGHDSK
jgi:hypothetical protein